MPSRTASFALGTGDIDCVYHFALYELIDAIKRLGAEDSIELLSMLVNGKRLKDISDLPMDLQYSSHREQEPHPWPPETFHIGSEVTSPTTRVPARPPPPSPHPPLSSPHPPLSCVLRLSRSPNRAA